MRAISSIFPIPHSLTQQCSPGKARESRGAFRFGRGSRSDLDELLCSMARGLAARRRSARPRYRSRIRRDCPFWRPLGELQTSCSAVGGFGAPDPMACKVPAARRGSSQVLTEKGSSLLGLVALMLSRCPTGADHQSKRCKKCFGRHPSPQLAPLVLSCRSRANHLRNLPQNVSRVLARQGLFFTGDAGCQAADS